MYCGDPEGTPDLPSEPALTWPKVGFVPKKVRNPPQGFRRWRSFDAVEYATLEWVDWFNNRRLLEPIGNMPPAEAEANFYAALEKSDVAA